MSRPETMIVDNKLPDSPSAPSNSQATTFGLYRSPTTLTTAPPSYTPSEFIEASDEKAPIPSGDGDGDITDSGSTVSDLTATTRAGAEPSAPDAEGSGSGVHVELMVDKSLPPPPSSPGTSASSSHSHLPPPPPPPQPDIDVSPPLPPAGTAHLSSPPTQDSTPVPSHPPSPALRPTLPRKTSSWLSILSLGTATSRPNLKQTRASVLATIHELVIPSHPDSSSPESTLLPTQDSSHHRDSPRPNPASTLAACLDACAPHKSLSLSALLQEPSIADHTPLYWAVIQQQEPHHGPHAHRADLLPALLRYAAPLTAETISDLQHACLATSNQVLFAALRGKRAPFHGLGGEAGAKTATDALFANTQVTDDVHVRNFGTEGAFVAIIDIALWHRRMRIVGRVGVDFIASGRLWTLTIIAPSVPSSTPAPKKKGKETWHVVLTLLEHSPPTYVDAQLVVEVPVAPRHSSTAPGLGNPGPANATGEPFDFTSASSLSLATASSPPDNAIVVPLSSGKHKLAYRAKGGDIALQQPATAVKSETWSEAGVPCISKVVAPLGEEGTRGLVFDNSPYLMPNGTLRVQLGARLTKTETSEGCVVC